MSRRARTALAAAVAALGTAATAARAQEASRDRADLDLAAGRAVPVQASAAERPSERVAEAAPGAPAATRRPVRVVLPSPYGR